MKKIKKAYLIGIKGVAMTALAVILKEKGYQVTGSDKPEQFATDIILNKHKIPVKVGFLRNNLSTDYDLVVVTGAHGGMTNIEAVAAIERKMDVYMHGKYIGILMGKKTGISVAGCHGKTTTSALISSLLVHLGTDPSYAVGAAMINDLGAAGHYGRGKYFVVEADEYMTCPLTDKTPRFLWQFPEISVITNIDYDHPDAYENINEVKSAYFKFIGNTSPSGVVVACIDNQYVAEILPKIKRTVITYGFSPRADYRINKYHFGEGVSFLQIKSHGVNIGEFMLRIPGRHNLLNALGAMVAVNQTGVSWDKIKKAVKYYTGCKRRFELIAKIKNTLLYDDYAHHPSEIMATLGAVKQWYPDYKLTVIFQPHTFSRTKVLMNDFARAFTLADKVLVVDIYASAREKADTSINSSILAEKINKEKKNAEYFQGKAKCLEYLSENKGQKEIILTMGAGDIFLWHKDIITVLN
jgi:UDP-N-acetylmuramate--alanine ligase